MANEIRLLRRHIYSIIQSFKCSLESAKRSYRAANAVPSKVGITLTAPEEVTLQVIKSECLSMLLYGFEVCPLYNCI